MALPEHLQSFYYKHGDDADAFQFRIELIARVIREKKNECFWRELVLRILKALPRNLPREYYDYESAKLLYYWIRERVPFRKDSYDVETIQWPEITLEYGGDCDCLVVLGAVMLLNAGIEAKLMVSKQLSQNKFDHIAIYIPSLNKVFDLTYPGGFPMDLFRLSSPSLITISLNSETRNCNG